MLKIVERTLAGAILAFWSPAAIAQVLPPKTVALERLVEDEPKGDIVLTAKTTPFCISAYSSPAPKPGERDIEPHRRDFADAIKASGLHPLEQTDLFSSGAPPSADYALGGVLTKMTMSLCFPGFKGGKKDGEIVTDYGRVKGEGSLTVEWQLFSRLENKVVARPQIKSTYSTKAVIFGGVSEFTERLMAENFKLLAANPEFRAQLSGNGLAKGELIKPLIQPSIILDGVRSIAPIAIDRAAASVMVIYAGDTLGSGVLISRDGYILTDAHVVGSAAVVRLRWSDGNESTAQVLRVATDRDVALLKTDASGRAPLPLQAVAPSVGATVYAIGSPEGDAFQGTLTRGVVSAIRPLNGLNYIQSDVTTGHGGSGGPLLDDKGYVVGLTDLGIGHDTTSSGLNFFTPVKDLIEFLNLDPR